MPARWDEKSPECVVGDECRAIAGRFTRLPWGVVRLPWGLLAHCRAAGGAWGCGAWGCGP